MSSSTSSIHSIDKLNGSNYHAWKFKIQMVLIDKDIWDVIDGSEEEPMAESSVAASGAWNKKDKKALATICLSVTDSELVYV